MPVTLPHYASPTHASLQRLSDRQQKGTPGSRQKHKPPDDLIALLECPRAAEAAPSSKPMAQSQLKLEGLQYPRPEKFMTRMPFQTFNQSDSTQQNTKMCIAPGTENFSPTASSAPKHGHFGALARKSPSTHLAQAVYVMHDEDPVADSIIAASQGVVRAFVPHPEPEPCVSDEQGIPDELVAETPEWLTSHSNSGLLSPADDGAETPSQPMASPCTPTWLRDAADKLNSSSRQTASPLGPSSRLDPTQEEEADNTSKSSHATRKTLMDAYEQEPHAQEQGELSMGKATGNQPSGRGRLYGLVAICLMGLMCWIMLTLHPSAPVATGQRQRGPSMARKGQLLLANEAHEGYCSIRLPAMRPVSFKLDIGKVSAVLASSSLLLAELSHCSEMQAQLGSSEVEQTQLISSSPVHYTAHHSSAPPQLALAPSHSPEEAVPQQEAARVEDTTQRQAPHEPADLSDTPSPPPADAEPASTFEHLRVALVAAILALAACAKASRPRGTGPPPSATGPSARHREEAAAAVAFTEGEVLVPLHASESAAFGSGTAYMVSGSPGRPVLTPIRRSRRRSVAPHSDNAK